MSLINIEKKYAWSFLGFILGTISLLIAIGVFYYSEKKDIYDLNLTIEEEFNLIDLRERIPALQVLYQGENILTSKREIKVLKISLRNNGKSILQSMYDINQKFGFIFKKSEILNFQIIASNSDYITDNLKPIITSSTDSVKNFLQLNKIIFEPDKYVVLKIYLIQTAKINKTEIEEVGKVAGIDKFSIIQKPATGEKPNVETSFLNYILFGYGGFLGFVIIVVFILAFFEKRKNKKQLKSFLDTYPQYNDKSPLLMKLIKNSNFLIISKAILNKDIVFNIETKNNPSVALNKAMEKILPKYMRRFFILPTDIFRTENDFIYLQEENKDLIEFYIKFIKQKKIMKSEKASKVG